MQKVRSSFMSCHASHRQASSDSTSKLFRKLVKYVKSERQSFRDEVVDLTVIEMLNRTFVLNLTPPGELQYDEPNVPTIERLTQSRIYWTFSYDTPVRPVTRQTEAEADEVHSIRSRIVEAILTTTLNMSEGRQGSNVLRVLFTTAPHPTVNKAAKDVYSLIEFANSHISASNLFDVGTLKGDLDAAVKRLTESVDHTRFYIGVKEGTSTTKANAIMTAFYRTIMRALHEIDDGKGLLRKHSNELAYFSPNALEVARSLLPALNSLHHATSIDINSQINHPYLEHTEVATGYSLMCGPDILLHKRTDEIAYTRVVGTHELRFPPSLVSLVDQLKIHFGSWIKNIQVSQSEPQEIKRFPEISTFVLVVHACNECSTKSDSGRCECYLNIDPEIVLHGHQYVRSATDRIKGG